MADKMKCQHCGKFFQKDATHCPHCGEAVDLKKIKRRKIIKWGVVLALIAIVATVTFFLLRKTKADMIKSGLTEEQSWDLICQYRDTNEPDSLDGALQRYADEFPKGEHAFDVKTLKGRLEKEAKLWQKVEEGGSQKDAVEKYLFEYKEEGFFFLRAIAKLDSITFFEKQELNTVEAYQEYLDQYPDGAYIENARQNLAKLDAVPLTEAEEEGAKEIILKHFKALENNDTTLAKSTVAKNMSSYLGKKPCSQKDVGVYIRHMYEVPGRTITFDVTDMFVKKMTAFEGSDPIYNVSFTLQEEMNKPNKSALDDETSKTFKGTAIINDDMLITSLLLE